ncbi:hypothetical protein B0H10DRAFT_759595 [Mycena sp. CBHHK59/15]|nr:hypothetical protein B0H10DRAFT_759595 [Mycena sp. CBHHK59/15]
MSSMPDVLSVAGLRLPHLKTLTFGTTWRGRTARSIALLGFVTLSVPQKLDVGILQPSEIENLFSFLSRSPCNLLEFPVNAEDTPLASLTPCLQAMPTLTSLRLTVRVASRDRICSMFEQIGRDRLFLPALQHLRVIGDGSLEVPYDGLFEMLVSRSDSDRPARLPRFPLHHTSLPKPSILDSRMQLALNELSTRFTSSDHKLSTLRNMN